MNERGVVFIMQYYFYYCACCGNLLEKDDIICNICRMIDPVRKSKKPTSYYNEKSIEKYGHTDNTLDFLMEEALVENPEFEPSRVYYFMSPEEKKKCDEEHSRKLEEIFSKTQNINTPKCPTCQSQNIMKISTTSKVIGAGLFGLFSKTARSQFECKNCGYKW